MRRMMCVLVSLLAASSVVAGAEAQRVKTLAALKALGVKSVIFAERHPGWDPQGHYYANFGYSCTDENLWLHGKDGGRLCKLNVASGEVSVLVDDPKTPSATRRSTTTRRRCSSPTARAGRTITISTRSSVSTCQVSSRIAAISEK